MLAAILLPFFTHICIAHDTNVTVHVNNTNKHHFSPPVASVAIATSEGCTRSATVVAGDTCDIVSTKFGVSTFQLALVNSPEVNERCDNLEPGQDVCLGVDAYDCKKVYTVVKGDTCSWLETMYGMTQDTLHANNPQINPDCTNIYIGQVLCVDTQAFPYPEYNASAYNMVAEAYLPYCDEL